MTPKEYAEELVEKYNKDEELFFKISLFEAKVCALIAVNEMLENDGWSSSQYEWDVFKKYFIEVIEEIKKI